MKTGRIDVHSHILPGIDDGCATIDESLNCARQLVEAGYTHSFCTPHVWPNLPNNNNTEIPKRVAELQEAVDHESIPLKLLPGGELNFGAHINAIKEDQIVSYRMARRHILIDMWVDKIPDHFDERMKWFQNLGLTVILAHPERMRAVQDDPTLAQRFLDMGLLLQGNLQCFTDAPSAATFRTAERFLKEHRYFLLATDLHNPENTRRRLAALSRIEEIAGEETLDRLTKENPKALL